MDRAIPREGSEMGVTNYYSVNGQLLGEATSGVETTYMTDALGSTIGTVTTAGLRNRYTYKPYGGQLSKTGADPDPRFTWNARSGYRVTNRSYSEDYTRRRHVSTVTAQWTTRDPLWPRQAPYVYVAGAPQARSDPSGMIPIGPFIWWGFHQPTLPWFLLPPPPRPKAPCPEQPPWLKDFWRRVRAPLPPGPPLPYVLPLRPVRVPPVFAAPVPDEPAPPAQIAPELPDIPGCTLMLQHWDDREDPLKREGYWADECRTCCEWYFEHGMNTMPFGGDWVTECAWGCQDGEFPGGKDAAQSAIQAWLEDTLKGMVGGG